MDWYTTGTEEDTAPLERLQAAWDQAPVENLEVLGMILDTARDQVIAYAPRLPEPAAGEAPTPPPARYVYAQLQQARNLWNAGSVSSAGEVGPDGYTFTPRPLDKTVRAIIRPVDGRPHVL